MRLFQNLETELLGYDIAVCRYFFEKNHIQADHELIKTALLNNPFSPGIIAIKDVLDEFGFITELLEGDAENLHEFENIAILQMQTESISPYCIFNDLNAKFQSYDLKKRNWVKYDSANLNSDWTGLALSIKRSDRLIEPQSFPKSKKILRFMRSPLLLFCAAVLGTGIIINNIRSPHLLTAIVIPVCLAAVLTCYELVRMALGGNQTVLSKKFCSLLQKNGCEELMTTNKLNNFGVTPAELGLAFFSGIGLLLTIAWYGNFIEYALKFTALYAAVSLPFVLFFLAYQFLEKKWCAWCLFLNASVLFIIAILFPYFDFAYLKEKAFLQTTLIWFVISCFTGGIWLYWQPLLLKSIQSKNYWHALAALKKNPKVLSAFLRDEKKLKIQYLEGSLRIGSGHAPLLLTVIISPLCTGCRQAFYYLVELSQRFPDEIDIYIHMEPTEKTPVAKNIYDRCIVGNHEEGLALMKSWFEMIMNSNNRELNQPEIIYDKWLLHSKESAANKISQEHFITLFRNWTLDNQLNRAPDFYINGFRWPESFDWQMMHQYIEALADDKLFIHPTCAEEILIET